MSITNTEIIQPEDQQAAPAETAASKAATEEQPSILKSGHLGTVIIRLALGFTTLFTWLGNVQSDFYSADGLTGYFNWAFTPAEDGGNGSTLLFVRDILDATILQAPGAFGAFQTVFELLIALFLIFGVFTRATAVAATGFFFSLFLVQFGGDEWIWTYVLLVAGAITVGLNSAGRYLGVDQWLLKTRGESPRGLLW